jgi:hypothetical protein
VALLLLTVERELARSASERSLAVAQLAERWGTRCTPQGKVIWSEQTLPYGYPD